MFLGENTKLFLYIELNVNYFRHNLYYAREESRLNEHHFNHDHLSNKILLEVTIEKINPFLDYLYEATNRL